MTVTGGIALLVDDHELFRIALSTILISRMGYRHVIGVGSVEEAMQALDRHPEIGLVTLDLCMPGFEDLGVFSVIRKAYPQAVLVAVSGSATYREAVACGDAGAYAFIPKALSADEISAALQRILAGEAYVPVPDPARVTMYMEDGWKRPIPGGTKVQRLELLTARQAEVYKLLVLGLSNKEIARMLDLSSNTVKVHALAICRMLGVHDRRELVQVSA